MKLVELNNIYKKYDDNVVLDGISMHVDEGEVLAIIGPSGSGKSTMLRLATLLEEIDGGQIKYLGEDVATTSGETVQYIKGESLKKVHTYFGLVFQHFNLFPHFSVIKNITDPLIRNQKMPKNEALEIGRKLLKKMGLQEKENSYPNTLSGGQKQRVSIARALASSPKVLYFDEPTSALDPELTKEVLTVIKELTKEKMTMVIVTHEMAFAKQVASRIIFMEGGKIVDEGTPEEVFDLSENQRTKSFIKGIS